MTVETARRLSVAIVDDRDQPVPFAPVTIYMNPRISGVVVPTAWLADSRGKINLTGIPRNGNVNMRSARAVRGFVNKLLDDSVEEDTLHLPATRPLTPAPG